MSPGTLDGVHSMRTLLLVAVAATVTPAPAHAAMKSCARVTGHPGGNATWRIDRIRLTEGFGCSRARKDIKTWVGFGGMMDNPRALTPWRCNLGPRTRCTLKTTFGGTKPMRTYRLQFRITSV